MVRLIPASTLLLVVDVQEKLAPAMPPETLTRLVQNTCILLEAARLLGVHVLATEQYPKGLGPTVAPIAEKLREMNITPISKIDFDALAEPAVARHLGHPRAVVVVGMETHICVFQTARELVHRSLPTFVVADAVASRREENRLAGLALAREAGAIPTVTETVLFDWLGRAEGDAFKTLSKLVR